MLELEGRYHLRNQKPFPSGDATLEDIARWFLDRAKAILSADGYHVIVVALFPNDNAPHFMELQPDDQADKYVLMRKLATEVKRIRAHTIVLVAEVWVAKFDKNHPFRHAVEAPDRTEAINVIAASRTGRSVVLTLPFERIEKKISFSEAEDVAIDQGNINLLSPVLQAWKEMASSG